MTEEKVWGRTTELFRNNTTSTHYLEIKKGGYCSEHQHAQKSNIFYVISGSLSITEWVDGKQNQWVLNAGGVHLINPGNWHYFSAITDVKCIEIYDYMYDGEDIERRVEGGLDST